MKSSKFLILLIIIFLISCKRNTQSIPAEVYHNIFKKNNEENYYYLNYSVKNLNLTFTDTLYFNIDSLIIIDEVKNFESGKCKFKLSAQDSHSIRYRYFHLNYERIKSYKIGSIPYTISYNFIDFTGNLRIHITTQRDSSMYDSRGLVKHPDAFYFNSFEEDDDILNFSGEGWYQRYNEAPLDCGLYSLYVSGGCEHPHVVISLDPLSSDGFYLLQCWGKNLSWGGGLQFYIKGKRYQAGWPKYSIGISDLNWKFYQIQDSLFCPADSSLEIGISAGGDSPSSIIVDQLQVLKIK